MRRSYQITGITLKGSTLGEADRLLTILSPEMGLVRAIAPGARNAKSALRGRCEIFGINRYWINQGRSLGRITQIETLDSYPDLTKEIGKLTAGQYLAEVALCLALTEEPQPDLYSLLNEHLRRVAALTPTDCLHAYLTQAIFHLLALGGFAPSLYYCGITQQAITVNFDDPRWQMGFSFEQGGLVAL
ncbi:MAG: DNA repair protein RecO, partial [Microcystaceae cyanobacterium]